MGPFGYFKNRAPKATQKPPCFSFGTTSYFWAKKNKFEPDPSKVCSFHVESASTKSSKNSQIRQCSNFRFNNFYDCDERFHSSAAKGDGQIASRVVLGGSLVQGWWVGSGWMGPSVLYGKSPPAPDWISLISSLECSEGAWKVQFLELAFAFKKIES